MTLYRDIFLDTEFLSKDGKVDLISLALVEGDKSLYCVCNEFDLGAAQKDLWVAENVLPQIPPSPSWLSKWEIQERVELFIGNPSGVRFWAYMGAHDWVGFVHLWGSTNSLPARYPKFYWEFRQLAPYRSFSKDYPIPYQGKPHDALFDAFQLQANYRALLREKQSPTC